MDFIIKRKILISMLFAGLSMLGYFSYKNLPVALFPNAEMPVFYIQVGTATEVSPGYMEQQAILPLEGVAGTLEGVELIESLSTGNRGSITLTYSQNTDIKFAYLELLEKVETVRPNLPDGFIVNVVKFDTEMVNNILMSLQVRGSGGVNRVREITDKEIKTALENIDGVASASVFGGREKTLEVVLNNALCEMYGITPARVRSLLTQNTASRTFVGEVYEGQNRYFVNVNAEYQDILDIGSIVVQENGQIKLKEIAEIFFGVKEGTTISRVNGKDAVSIQLMRDAQANMIDLSHSVHDVIAVLNRQLAGQDVEIVVQNNVAETMETNMDQIMELAFVGGLLAVFVLWVFLRNIRLVLAIGLAIPISVLTAFNFFYAYNISINSLTLVGMALALGMLVDNSVVVLENIYRHASRGKSRGEAVVQGAYEVRRSIVAATLTTVTVFLPFLFSSDFYVKIIGQHVGVSIISTMVVSLFVALLLIPMVAYVFVGSASSEMFKRVSIHNSLIRAYIVLLKGCMRYPLRTVIWAVVSFFVVILLSITVSMNTLQEVESDQLEVQVTMPGGADLERTDGTVAEIEKRLGHIDEIQDIISNIREEDAVVQLKLREDYSEINDRNIAGLRAEIIRSTEGIQDAEVSVNSSLDTGTGSGGAGGGGRRRGASGFQQFLGIGAQQEVMTIKGQNFEQMRKVAEDMRYYLEGLNAVQNANLSISDNRPEAHILFDQRIMSRYGVGLQEVTNELSGFQSEFNSGVRFKNGLEEYDITIKTDEPIAEQERTMADLKALEIIGPTESVHALEDLGNIYYSTGLWGISRTNQEKEILVTYAFYDEYNESNDLLAAARQEVAGMVAGLVLPSGVAVEVEEPADTLGEYKFLILASAILIFMILASLFESMVTPFVLMFSIPLAAIGSFLGLLFTGNSLTNPNALTGLLILLGVVVNNSIILIDYSNILQRRGYSRVRALITAGIGRVRPILITAITTIVAMMPLAMGQMEYVAAIGAPFAITVIGGLALSTVLTLVFVPTLSIGLENILEWFRGLKWQVQVLQGLAFIGGVWLVAINIDSDIWKSIWVFVLLVCVPGMSWFLLNSLKQAREEVIARSEPITIKIENLVKIYGRGNRMSRDWEGGKRRAGQSGGSGDSNIRGDFSSLLWELPAWGFLIYFTYFYLEGPFWFFVFAVTGFVLTLHLLRSIGLMSKIYIRKNGIARMGSMFYQLVFWGLPAGNGAWFYLQWENIPMTVFLMLVWYLALFVFRAALKLAGDFNIEALRSRVKRMFYRLVFKIPVIGKKREPFKALRGVSLEIGKGMFGLLGPNGAGKTTLMRTVCGIFDQSYGKIWFNEFDTTLHREELQGLIGYLPQEFGMYENMSPHEYLHYQAILKGILDKKLREERVDYVLAAVNMLESQHEDIGSFSGGMKQRIGIAQILLHLPRILVVDEPTAGLDPRERIRFRNLLVELGRERIVIFSTHIIEDIASSCNKVAVLNRGELKYVGSPVDMAGIAEGKVWQFNVSQEAFDALPTDLNIIHHMRDGRYIRVRCLSAKKPAADAVSVRPLLEDSYLWLMRDRGQVMSIHKKAP